MAVGHSVKDGTRRAREGMLHYRPRRGSGAERLEQARTCEQERRRAARDAAYREALGLARDELLPKMLGQARGHSRVSVPAQRRDA